MLQEYPPVGTSAPPRMTFVEVKSSTTANKYYFEISHREWNLAQQHVRELLWALFICIRGFAFLFSLPLDVMCQSRVTKLGLIDPRCVAPF